MFNRTLLPIVMTAAIALLTTTARAEEAPSKPKKPKLEYVYLAVQNAKTDQIAQAAQRRVEAVRGVQSFSWTIERTEAKVVRIVGQASTLALAEAFRQAGTSAAALAVGQQKMTFQSKLHCNGCVITVKRALKSVKGTKEVSVSKDMLTVTVVYDTKKATVAQLKKALADAGKPVR